MSEPIHIISLGAGVQSYAMFEMAEAGIITPKPVAAAFANTDWELPETMELVKRLQKTSSIPIYILGKKSLRDIAMSCSKTKWWPGIPVYSENDKGKEGKLRRKCTTSFKVALLEQFSKDLMGSMNAPSVIQWKGLTTDEIYRLKPSKKAWYSIRWPLCELGMNREQCKQWLISHELAVPSRSACIGCPYHSDSYWAWLKSKRPVQWQEAVAFDERIRNGVKGLNHRAFVHRSLKPLSEIDFSTEEERGQLNMFNNECEGMCGV
ncbi:MAG: hypothetical protein V4563_14090 [Pseudomonadota bacterium]